MYCKPNSTAVKRYILRCIWATCYYIVSVVITKITLRHHPSQLLAILFSGVSAMGLVAVVAIVGLYLKEEKDEFQRELLVQNLLWATAGTITATSTWGLIEMFSDVPRLPVYYVFVMFWIFFALASLPLRLRYRSRPNE
jgi:hypothetical protein